MANEQGNVKELEAAVSDVVERIQGNIGVVNGIQMNVASVLEEVATKLKSETTPIPDDIRPLLDILKSKNDHATIIHQSNKIISGLVESLNAFIAPESLPSSGVELGVGTESEAALGKTQGDDDRSKIIEDINGVIKQLHERISANNNISNAISTKVGTVASSAFGTTFSAQPRFFDLLSRMSEHYRIMKEINKDNEYSGFMKMREAIDDLKDKKQAETEIIDKIVLSTARIAGFINRNNVNEQKIIPELLSELAPMKVGGADAGNTTPDGKPAVNLKQMLEDAKLALRNATNTTDDIQSKYTSFIYKFHTSYDQYKNDAKEEKEDKNVSLTNFENYVKKITTATSGSASDASQDFTLQQDELRGLSDSVQSEKEWASSTAPKQIYAVLDHFNKMKKTLDDMGATDLNNVLMTKCTRQLKLFADGDPDAKDGTPEAIGISDHLEKISSGIKGEYDTISRIIQTGVTALKTRESRQEKKDANNAMAARNANARYYGGKATTKERVGRNTAGAATPMTTKDRMDYVVATLQKIKKTIIVDFNQVVLTSLGPEFASLSPEPSLFKDIYSKFMQTKSTDGTLKAALGLKEAMQTNDLIPSEVLKISSVDKGIFIFVILVLRLLSISCVEYFISKNWINDLITSVMTFAVIYSILFVIFVLAVNFDLYRFRIMFNYVNMHVNGGIILSHLLEVWALTFVVLTVLQNINVPIAGLDQIILNNEDKSFLMYRMEMITMIIWVILLLLVMVM